MPTWYPTQTHLQLFKDEIQVARNWQALADRDGDDLEIISTWLARLFLLQGVPFDYLVPDERMLPSESIRFFLVDPNWLDALQDGASSIGRRLKQDIYHDAGTGSLVSMKANEEAGLQRRRLRRLPDPPVPVQKRPVSGLLLRSALVSGWPGLEIEGYSIGKDGEEVPVEILRMERLSETVMICLFDAPIGKVHVKEPSEGVHFGALETDGSYELESLRGLGSGGVGAGEPIDKKADIPTRAGADRVIDVLAMVSNIKKALDKACPSSFTSAEFAVEFVRPPANEVFQFTDDGEAIAPRPAPRIDPVADQADARRHFFDAFFKD